MKRSRQYNRYGCTKWFQRNAKRKEVLKKMRKRFMEYVYGKRTS